MPRKQRENMAQHWTLAQLRTAINPVLAAAKSVTNISQASPAACTATAHGYLTGDYIFLTAPSVDAGAGPQVYKLTKTGANTFTIPYDNTGGTGGAQTASALKITAGLVANLKPYQIGAIRDAFDRQNVTRDGDQNSGAAESTLDNIFPLTGNNP